MSEADPQADVETPGPSPFAEQLRVSSPFAEQFRVPQFGIIHLLIWSTVTAVLLKYYLAIADESSFQESPVQLWLIRISQSLSAILVGSIVIGSGILIRARCYKMLRRLQPGHWLVLVVTFRALLNLIAWPIYRHFLREFDVGLGLHSRHDDCRQPDCGRLCGRNRAVARRQTMEVLLRREGPR